MSKVAIILAEGFEEIEALTAVDILRRANITIDILSLKDYEVSGSHNIIVKVDKIISETIKDEYDMLVLPGGKRGTDNLKNSQEVIAWLKYFAKEHKYIAAICAAPTVLAEAGIITGKRVTSYPETSFKEEIINKNATYIEDSSLIENLVVVDDNIITSRGPATTFSFAYKLVELLNRDICSLKEAMLYNELERNIKND